MEDKNNELELDVKVNKEEVEDTLDELNEAFNEMNIPNVTIRNNQNVYVTMNYWNRESKE